MTNKTREQAIEKLHDLYRSHICGDFKDDGSCSVCPHNVGGECTDGLELIKKMLAELESLGYAPPDKVIKVIGNEIEYFIEVSALEKWVESHGYVKKSKDQSLPKCERLEWYNENYEPGCGMQERGCDFNLMVKECPLLKANFVKVEEDLSK